MHMQCSLTIVVPTLGCRAVLRKCLDALVDQSAPNQFEVLVVYNNPNHAGASLPVSLVEGCRAVRICKEPNVSVGAARNRGLAEATSEFVAFTDDDCIVPRDWVAGIRVFLKQNPQCRIAGGLIVEPERKGDIYRFMRRINYMRTVGEVKRRPGGILSLGAANMVVHRNTALTLGGFNEMLSSTEDYEFLVRAHAGKIPLGFYGSVSPVVHYHETDLHTFLRRYWCYGRGVAETVSLHRLDKVAHRIYCNSSWAGILPASIRFVKEDLRANPSPQSSPRERVMDALLGLARGVAFQAGAYATLRRGSHA